MCQGSGGKVARYRDPNDGALFKGIRILGSFSKGSESNIGPCLQSIPDSGSRSAGAHGLDGNPLWLGPPGKPSSPQNNRLLHRESTREFIESSPSE